MSITMNSFFNIGVGNANASSNNWMSGILSNVSDYNSIRSGAYGKLMKAYYAPDASSTVKKLAGSDSKTDKKVTEAKADADDLKTSAAALTATGSKSLFSMKEITTTDEETGEKTTKKDYDKDAIISAIKSFAEDYNNTIESASDTDHTRILQKALSMTKITNSNKNLLGKVGISVESGNKLTVHEDTLKDADIGTLKSLFNGSGSYASQIESRASDISNAAVNASLSASLYTSNAAYVGNSYNSLVDFGI